MNIHDKTSGVLLSGRPLVRIQPGVPTAAKPKGFAAVFPQGDVIVYVRPGDMRFADDIKKAFGRDCKVESSDEITIGGCRAGVAGGSTVADDTLDTRLEAQREWFLENSGMSVIL